jgi:Peptidase A4 family
LAPGECWASLNWGGYVDYNASYLVTKVVGTWTVPVIVGARGGTCPDAQKTWDDHSDWVGIDGFMDGTVEQTGTASDCFYGQVAYYPWYEFYPAGSEAFPAADVVNGGDLMVGEVNYVGPSEGGPVFTTTLTDLSQHWSFTSPATAVPGAEMNSAEWISESAYYDGFLGLTQVQHVAFSDAYATINGVTHSVGNWGSNVQWLTMVDYAWSPGTGLTYVKAYPSALSQFGSGFSVTWVSNGP